MLFAFFIKAEKVLTTRKNWRVYRVLVGHGWYLWGMGARSYCLQYVLIEYNCYFFSIIVECYMNIKDVSSPFVCMQSHKHKIKLFYISGLYGSRIC